MYIILLLFFTRLIAYELPAEHPVKPLLDAIFQNEGILDSVSAMEEAGFKTTYKNNTQLIFATHPALSGYVIKVYLDGRTRFIEPPEYYWKNRIEGAESVRATIKERNLEKWFKVPHKWIYYLPPDKEYSILVEEDMQLVSPSKNIKLWRTAISKKKLKSLYLIVETNGMEDSCKPDNACFSIDGKIAFIDTQKHHEWPPTYRRLNKHLSSDMKKYWRKITNQR